MKTQITFSLFFKLSILCLFPCATILWADDPLVALSKGRIELGAYVIACNDAHGASFRNLEQRSARTRPAKIPRDRETLSAGQIMAMADRNRDGKLTPVEMSSIFLAKVVKWAFSKRDANKSGTLEPSEINGIMTMCIRPTFLPFVLMDLDHDGTLRIQEMEKSIGDKERARRLYLHLVTHTNDLLLFVALDTNHDRWLSRSEIETRAGKRRTGDIMKFRDRDSNGKLSMGEARGILSTPRRKDVFAQFRRFDTNDDKKISKRELAAKHGKFEARKALLIFDRNGDGAISMSEHLNQDAAFEKSSRIYSLDANGDRRLSTSELLKELGSKSAKLFIVNLDTDGSGDVSFTELAETKPLTRH